MSANGPVWGSTFDGGTYLVTQNEVANMPQSSAYGLVSYSYRYLGGDSGLIVIQNV